MPKKFLTGLNRLDFTPSQYTYEIQRRIGHGYYFDKEQCDISGNTWINLKVIDAVTGQYVYSDYFCIDVVFDATKAYILVYPNGVCIVKELKDRSLSEIIRDLITSAMRAFEVLGQIALVFDIRPMLDTFAKISKVQNLLPEKIGEILGNVITAYQTAAARIDKTIHVTLLLKLSKIGRVLSPEYNEYWKSQESMLAEYSYRIFGDNHTLSSYVHIAELTYSILIKNTNRTEEHKRYASLQHGAKVTNRVMKKVRTYERNSLAVYSDIMYYTFGEGNKYREKYELIIGAEFIEALNNIGNDLKEYKVKMNDLRKTDLALSNLRIGKITNSITDITDLYNNNYNNILKPTFKVIQGIYEKQQRAIAELERRELEKLAQEQRSFLLSTDPAQLTEEEQIIQANQFINTMNNAVAGIDERFKFKTFDIGDL